MAFRAAEYERFQGERSTLPAWWPVLKATVHRGWANTWVRRLTLGSGIFALVVTIVLYLLYKVMPEWRSLLQQFGEFAATTGAAEAEDFVVGENFYLGMLNLYTYPVLLPLAVLFGQDLVSADLRANSLEAYFSRPLTPLGYLLGRTFAYVGFLLAATWLPLMWIWGFDAISGPDGHYETIRKVPGSFFLALTGVALTLALVVQATTCLSRSSTWTTMGLVVLFLFSPAVAHILFEITGVHATLALSLPEDIHVLTRATLVLEPLPAEQDSPTTAGAMIVFGCLSLISLIILHQKVLNKKGAIG